MIEDCCKIQLQIECVSNGFCLAMSLMLKSSTRRIHHPIRVFSLLKLRLLPDAFRTPVYDSMTNRAVHSITCCSC